MKRILAAIAGLFILNSTDIEARQSTAKKVVPRTMTLPEAVEFVRPSVVQMTMNLDQFSGSAAAALGGRLFVSSPLGSGFFVNEDGYVVTALHVVRAFQDFQIEGRKRLFVALAGPNSENIRGNFGLVEFDIVDEDARHDLVLLKLKQNPFKGEMGKFMKVGDKEIEYDHKAAMLSKRVSLRGTLTDTKLNLTSFLVLTTVINR